ncbi:MULTISPECIES: RraA family protein [unclassified Pseudomonas]|uniref:RraA family protein n=1 Tax=unclassified Pseudomonas TaxID=196821 RepID=UPI000F56068B|nr:MULTISPECIES: RraA family protein [unclassified Pseudomonas]AZF26205.1 Dimethylmenaquinone methyltransferase family protein [Pseudomonas sp. R2-60-08W]AZF31571.1 Dimethylmenaquinone methyltransferase family protein [Pseudomonas sp. R4-35-07]AZF36847.1 Dimethylmenaquinone methyltransferase family protein [Pseudomonas sp. R4-39-08]AZF52514.1 Dimethylmenaquinone methyltransferase family protein [Pseudomonas sp. R4-34-07]
MSIGFRVLERARKVDAEWVARYREVPVANVSDSMNRMTAGGAKLRPMHRAGVLAGPALTVKARPGDNLMLHYALDIAEPGDVVVVDAGGDLSNALIGEMMVAYAIKRGVAGIVINGAIRDSAVIGADDFPLFAAGISHRGPYKDGPGEINVPIAIDGMVIEPGDLIIGDDDGLLCVPFDQVGEVYEWAAAKHAAESKQMEQIAIGTNDRTWVLESLKKKGCLLP